MAIVNNSSDLEILGLPCLTAPVSDPPDTRAADTLKTAHKRLREERGEIGYRTLTRTVQRIRLQENRTPFHPSCHIKALPSFPPGTLRDEEIRCPQQWRH